MLPDTALLPAFLAASLLLALTPGPAVLYILARTLAQGRASGMASVLGVALGNLASAVAAAFGVAAVLAASSAAFTVVKWAGAAYLVWLGVGLLRARPAAAAAAPAGATNWRRTWRDGFLVALLNPKTALFFAAFLPQFLAPGADALGQTLLLGTLFVLLATCTDVGYVLAAAAIAPRLARTGGAVRWGPRLAGLSLIGLGLLAAFGGRPATKGAP